MLGKKKHIVDMSLNKSLLVIPLVNMLNMALLLKLAVEVGPLIDAMTKMSYHHI